MKRGGDGRGRKTGLSGRPSVRVREGESEGATARAAERVQQQAAVRGCSTAGPQTRPDKWAERAGEQRAAHRGPVSASGSGPVPLLGRTANGRRLAGCGCHWAC